MLPTYKSWTGAINKARTGAVSDITASNNLVLNTLSANQAASFTNGIVAQVPNSGTGNITNRVSSGFWQYDKSTLATGWPTDSNTWFNLITSTHNNPSNYFSLQLASAFYDNNDLYWRSTVNSGTQSWNKVWSSGNFNPDAKQNAGEPIVQNATSAEKNPWRTIRNANGNQVYQFVNNTNIGVYDSLVGSLWYYAYNTDTFYIRGNAAWHDGNRQASDSEATSGTSTTKVPTIAQVSKTGITTPLPITGPAIRSVQNRLGDRPDLRDYNGLDMTGTNDCSDIFIKAVNDSGSNGWEWNIPTGTITLTKPILTNSNINGRFRGQGASPPVSDFGLGAVPRGPGTWLHFAHGGSGIVIRGQGGSTFRNLGTYRDQPVPSKTDANAPWAPADFGYDFDIQNTNDVLIEDVCLLNASRGISMMDAGARTVIRRVFGQPIVQGISAMSAYDTNRVQSTHFWPFWSLDPRVMRWTLNNGIAYLTARNDNAVWTDNFAIYYNVFLQMSNYAGNGASRPGGSSYKFQMTNPQSDGCRFFVYVEPNTTAITATFTGGYHQGHTSEVPGGGIVANGGSVYVDGSAHRLSFIGTEFTNASGSHVCVVGGSNGPSYVDLVRPLLGDFDLSNQGVAGLRGLGGFIGYFIPRKTWNYNSNGKTMLGVNCNNIVSGDF